MRRAGNSAWNRPEASRGIWGAASTIIVQTQLPSRSSNHTDVRGSAHDRVRSAPRRRRGDAREGATRRRPTVVSGAEVHGSAGPCMAATFSARDILMKIVIAGGSGFLGSPLAEMYAEDGHDVRVLTRSLQSGETRHDPGTGVPGITRVGWKADGASGPWATVVEAADGVINPRASRWLRNAGRSRRRSSYGRADCSRREASRWRSEAPRRLRRCW